jgi:hypothetical protein
MITSKRVIAPRTDIVNPHSRYDDTYTRVHRAENGHPRPSFGQLLRPASNPDMGVHSGHPLSVIFTLPAFLSLNQAIDPPAASRLMHPFVGNTACMRLLNALPKHIILRTAVCFLAAP